MEQEVLLPDIFGNCDRLTNRRTLGLISKFIHLISLQYVHISNSCFVKMLYFIFKCFFFTCESIKYNTKWEVQLLEILYPPFNPFQLPLPRFQNRFTIKKNSQPPPSALCHPGAQLGNFKGGGVGIYYRKDDNIHCLSPSVKCAALLFTTMA